MAKRTNPKTGIPKLHFFGQQDRPDSPEKILDRRFIAGDGKIPRLLQEMRTSKSIYVNTGEGTRKPEVKIEKLTASNKKDSWRIDIPIQERLMNAATARLGNTAVRQNADIFLKETDRNASFSAHRPAWIDASYSPKIITDLQQGAMRRFNGRGVSPLWVFGNDDRWSFRDSAWPWGLVGKVFNSNGKVGTGALIGDRIIATAGHMVPWNKEGWWMKFVPAYFDGSSLHGAGVESYVSDCRGYDVDGDVTGYDWAVCRLYEPLGSSLGYFGYNGYSSNWENDAYWSIIGYPGAVASGARPSFQGSVSSFDTDGDSNGGLEIETRADLTPGNSGGPMFGWWDGDPRLIGVVSGQEEDWTPGGWPWEWGDTTKGNVIAGGSGFTNMMAWGRTNWPL